MEKLIWRYSKKDKWHSAWKGDNTFFIIRKSTTDEKKKYCLTDAYMENIYFNKCSTAKKVAELIFNG